MLLPSLTTQAWPKTEETMTTLGWKERHGQTDWVQIMLRTKKKKRKIFPLWCNRIIWTSSMLLLPQNVTKKKKNLNTSLLMM